MLARITELKDEPEVFLLDTLMQEDMLKPITKKGLYFNYRS